MKKIMTVMLAIIYIMTGTISVMAGEPESVSDSVEVQTGRKKIVGDIRMVN